MVWVGTGFSGCKGCCRALWAYVTRVSPEATGRGVRSSGRMGFCRAALCHPVMGALDPPTSGSDTAEARSSGRIGFCFTAAGSHPVMVARDAAISGSDTGGAILGA